MSDISLPGIEAFLITLAVGALCALGLFVSLGLFAWASIAKRQLARRRSGIAAAAFGIAVVCAAALAVALD